MISVLAGFVTIFIGVFMVNGAKSSAASLLDKQGSTRTSSSAIRLSVRGALASQTKPVVSEQHLLKTFDDERLLISDEED